MPWTDSREFEFVRGARQKIAVSTKSGSLGGPHNTVSINWWRLDRDGYGEEHHGVDIPADIFEKIIQFVRGEEPETEPTLAEKADALMQRHKNGFINDQQFRQGLAALSGPVPNKPE